MSGELKSKYGLYNHAVKLAEFIDDLYPNLRKMAPQETCGATY